MERGPKRTEEEICEIRRARARDSRLYMQKTRKNQPVIGNKIDLLLKKIEKMSQ